MPALSRIVLLFSFGTSESNVVPPATAREKKLSAFSRMEAGHA